MAGRKSLVTGALVVLALVVLAFVIVKARAPKVTVPEEGPVVVEEKVPDDPEKKAAFDLRKAASACRIAIMQSAKDPATVEFLEDIEQTPSTTAENGDISFTIGIKASNQANVVARSIRCTAHREDAGWSITELKESAPKPQS